MSSEKCKKSHRVLGPKPYKNVIVLFSIKNNKNIIVYIVAYTVVSHNICHGIAFHEKVIVH